MRFIWSLCLAAGALAGSQQQDQKHLGHTPTTPKSQQFMSCKRTYGPGWETCGNETTSRFCYSSEQGQSCCAVDNGYCERGTWCAPVAGYCCLDGEDLETCARNAGSVSLLDDREVVVREAQVSVARRKDQWTLAGVGLGIGVVGLFMLSC
ncbi:hypothetical protein QBC36DRAFT_342407 [Triangularia setosa]|uniref:Uncharacterized protein n=1 Tax=Triangularia setosa TaxID=2587417 RepID=A0AAN6WFC5_9PEZI|nr:hypothetical protein QBC36DRAFT_342407 [Podospora setosa]